MTRNRLFYIGMLVFFTGCSVNPAVYVSPPEVFTRQRLLIARLEELSVLDENLNAATRPSVTMQGATQEQTLSAFQNVLSGQLGTGGNAVTPALVANPSLPTAPSGPNITLTSIDALQDLLAYRDYLNSVIRETELDDAHDLNGRALYQLKFDLAVVPPNHEKRNLFVQINCAQQATTDITIQQQDYSRWLASVNRMLLNDMYRIQSRALSKRLTDADKSMIQAYLSGIQENLPRLISAGRAGRLAVSNNRFDLQQQFNSLLSEDFGSGTQTRPETQRASPLKNLIDSCMGYLSDPTQEYPAEALSIAAANAVMYRYREKFKDVATFKGDTDTLTKFIKPDVEGIGFSKDAKYTGLDPSKYEDMLSRESSRILVESIQPATYAENISSVSARLDLLNLGVAINAALGKAGTIGDTLDYLSEQQASIEAIKRQPLAMGFIIDQKTFGWLLGPQFQINKNQQMEYNQQPTRYSFAVSVAVPSWWNQINLSGHYQWVDGDKRGETLLACNEQKYPLFKPGPITASDTDQPIAIDVPGDPDAFTSLVVYGDIEGRGPQIDQPLDRNNKPVSYSLTAGDNVTLLIRGRNVWRNAEVYVGNQKATKTQITNDMAGLYATFSKLSAPPAGDGNQDLTVVTSFGSDTLRQIVDIKPSTPPAIAAFATLGCAHISPDAPLNLNVDPKGFPFSFDLSSVKAELHDKSDPSQTDVAVLTNPGTNLNSSGGQLSYSLQKVANPVPNWWNSAATVSVDLVVPTPAKTNGSASSTAAASTDESSPATTSSDTSQPATGAKTATTTIALHGSSELVFFSSTSQEKLNAPDTMTYSNGKFTLSKMPLTLNVGNDLFFQAYPSLLKNDGSIKLRVFPYDPKTKIQAANPSTTAAVHCDATNPRDVQLYVNTIDLKSMLPSTTNENAEPMYEMDLQGLAKGDSLLIAIQGGASAQTLKPAAQP